MWRCHDSFDNQVKHRTLYKTKTSRSFKEARILEITSLRLRKIHVLSSIPLVCSGLSYNDAMVTCRLLLYQEANSYISKSRYQHCVAGHRLFWSVWCSVFVISLNIFPLYWEITGIRHPDCKLPMSISSKCDKIQLVPSTYIMRFESKRNTFHHSDRAVGMCARWKGCASVVRRRRSWTRNSVFKKSVEFIQ